MKRTARSRIGRRRPWRVSRALAVIFAALRVFIGLAVLQLSEVGHFGAELAEHAGLIVHEPDADDARENEPGHDCPPGCPKCHHIHASNAWLPTWLMPVAPVAVMPDGVLVDFPPVAAAPPGPPLSSVYRPPRRSLAST